LKTDGHDMIDILKKDKPELVEALDEVITEMNVRL
jgi:hypothetical protein